MNLRLSIVPLVALALGACAAAGITYESTTGSQRIRIELDDDWSLIRAEMNGERLPAERVRITDTAIEVLDEKGEVAHRMERLRDFGPAEIVWAEGAPLTLAPDVALVAPARVQIGVVLDEIDPALARQLSVDADEVFVIRDVIDDLPAKKAGLRPFDVVTRIDGNAPATRTGLMERLRAMSPGETLTLHALREGEEKRFELEVVERKGDSPFAITLRGLPPEEQAEARRAWAEAMERMRVNGAGPLGARELEKELDQASRRLLELYGEFPRVAPLPGGLGQSGVIVAPPSAPRAERALNERLNTMELRMERIERLLERLIEEREGAERPAPEPADPDSPDSAA